MSPLSQVTIKFSLQKSWDLKLNTHMSCIVYVTYDSNQQYSINYLVAGRHDKASWYYTWSKAKLSQRTVVISEESVYSLLSLDTIKK